MPQTLQANTSSLQRPGFTFIELIVVVVLIVFLSSAAIAGILRSQRVFRFNAADQQLSSFVREARSLAISGKGIVDYTDYDGDGCRSISTHAGGCMNPSEDDYVTPAHYGIHFAPGDAGTITLFADVRQANDSQHNNGLFDVPSAGTGFGEYENNKDIILAKYTLPAPLQLLTNEPSSNVTTVLYSPLFADIVFADDSQAIDMSGQLFLFGTEDDSGPVPVTRCYAIHPIAGIPEEASLVGVACP